MQMINEQASIAAEDDCAKKGQSGDAEKGQHNADSHESCGASAVRCEAKAIDHSHQSTEMISTFSS